jgi:hypothetical protein
MPNSLTQNRQKLLDNYLHLIDLIKIRSKLVATIQNQKTISSNLYPHFDFDREWILFAELASTLKGLSIRELLAISLLIESHAGAEHNKYPAWSYTVHLKHKNDQSDLHQLINPIMIFYFDRELFKKLVLHADFSSQFERAINESSSI